MMVRSLQHETVFKGRFSDNLAFKFLKTLSVILFISALVLSAVVGGGQWKYNERALMDKGNHLASYISNLSQDPLLRGDSIQLDILVNQANRDDDIIYAVIRDAEGNILTSKYSSINYRIPRIASALANLPGMHDVQEIIAAVKKEEAIREISMPIFIDVKPIGNVTIGLSMYQIRREVVRTVVFVIALSLSAAVALGIVLFVFSKKIILTPITTLAAAASRLAKGDLSTQVTLRTTGEMKLLVDSFNRMAENLEKTTVSRNFMNNIFRSMIDTLVIVSPEGRIRECNAAMCTILDLEENDLIGKNLETVIAKGTADGGPIIAEVRERGAIRNREVDYAGRDGRSIPMLFSASPIYDESGRFEGVVCMAHDITERKRAEEEKLSLERQVQQAQKLESLGVLAGGIAHDFNNILMAVQGHAELALGGLPPTSPARGNLAEITTATRRAADLCRQMLAYAGKASFALERVALGDIVEEMADLLKTSISKKAILALNLEKGLPPIQADPSQIRQIVMNLIINASEAIGDRGGAITVSVGTTRCDAEYLQKTELQADLLPGLYVHLEVSDSGSGMDAETRARIFEPFFTTKFTGRGLGLAAVLGIIRAYKGALKVYSEPGKGTTFKVLFPARTDGEDATRSLESSSPADWRGKGTILLVDDEESLLSLGTRMLEHFGFNVLTASDGRQAVNLYRERGNEIELVLMDLTMPQMDGAEAFGELCRLNPDARVVLASGYAEADVSSRFEGRKPAGIIQKPYTLSKVRETLAGLLPKRLDREE